MLRAMFCFAALLQAATAQVSYFAASLDGAQETPPVTTTGSGWAVIKLDEPSNAVTVFLHVENLSGPATQAHLHIGVAGIPGSIILPLTGGPSEWSATATMSAANVLALKTAGTYVNAHTAAHPGGEIRGQAVPSTTTRFVAVLDGSQVVPPATTTATGVAVAFLHEPDERLCYTLTTTGVPATLDAQLRGGAPGVTGPIVIALNGANGTYCGVSDKLSLPLVASLKAGLLYCNVDSAAFPAGEIRGQLLASVDDFSGAMSGAQETPPNTSTGIGAACIQLQPDLTVAYRVVVRGLSGP